MSVDDAAIDDPMAQLDEFEIEIPSWGLWRGGTRFETYWTDDDPRTIEERIDAAANVDAATGAVGSVSLHFPWDGDSTEDVKRLQEHLEETDLEAGSMNANLFTVREDSVLDARLRYGSFTSPFEDVREESFEHVMDCIEWMRLLDSQTLTLWLPDGTNSFGQSSLFDLYGRMKEMIERIAAELRGDEELLVEYKPFEPAFYATAIPDWGAAKALVDAADKNASVLVDVGHHLQAANVEQIIAYLAKLGDLGGFHFNDSKYADDDLVTGDLDPTEIFRIFTTLREAEKRGLQDLHDISYMIDQAHYMRDPTMAMVDSLENIQIAYLQSGLVDFDELETYRDRADMHSAGQVLYDARRTDVRPVLREWRERNGIPLDPTTVTK